MHKCFAYHIKVAITHEMKCSKVLKCLISVNSYTLKHKGLVQKDKAQTIRYHRLDSIFLPYALLVILNCQSDYNSVLSDS